MIWSESLMPLAMVPSVPEGLFSVVYVPVAAAAVAVVVV
jgi:hypothetical protein